MLKLKLLTAVFLIFCGAFLFINAASAISALSHISNSAVNTNWSANNVNLNLTFTVANNLSSNDSIDTIKINVPTGYTYSAGYCPVNWTALWTTPNFYCLTSTPLAPNSSIDMVLNVTAPNIAANSVKTYNWLVSTLDNQSSPPPSGNANSSTVTTGVDNQEPSMTVTFPLNNSNLSCTSLLMSGTADDYSGSGIKNIWISTDNGLNWNLANGTTNWNYNLTCSEGSYNILAKAEDNVENNHTTQVNFVVDNTAPDLTITAPSTLWHNTNIPMSVTATDAGVGVSDVGYRWENGTNSSWSYLIPNSGFYTGTFDISSLADGLYTLRFNATDFAGNENSSETVSIGLDKSGPNITNALLSKTPIILNQSIELSVRVASLSGIDNVIATFVYPNKTAENKTLSIKSGTVQDGFWNVSYEVNSMIKNLYGSYNITEIYANNSLAAMNELNVSLSFSLVSSCGNGVCEPGENCRLCSTDCGYCSSGGGSIISSYTIVNTTNSTNSTSPINTTNTTEQQNYVTVTNTTNTTTPESNSTGTEATVTQTQETPAQTSNGSITGMFLNDIRTNGFDSISFVAIASVALGLVSYFGFRFFRGKRHYVIK